MPRDDLRRLRELLGKLRLTTKERRELDTLKDNWEREESAKYSGNGAN